MNNIKELKKHPEPNVIEILENLLIKAKEGKISYIACVTVEDLVRINWGGSGNAFEVLGAIEYLKGEYFKDAIKRV